jgi:hypothetical protein
MIGVLKLNKKENEEGVWLDDGDCLICSICGKALDERLYDRKGESVRAPFNCPFCKIHMNDIKKA